MRRIRRGGRAAEGRCSCGLEKPGFTCSRGSWRVGTGRIQGAGRKQRMLRDTRLRRAGSCMHSSPCPLPFLLSSPPLLTTYAHDMMPQQRRRAPARRKSFGARYALAAARLWMACVGMQQGATDHKSSEWYNPFIHISDDLFSSYVPESSSEKHAALVVA